nr:sigma factor [Angustibacter aerolatus]
MSTVPAQDTGRDARAQAAHDLARLVALPTDHPERAVLRDRVVEAHLPLVRYLAQRYRDLGEPLDDLVQVGTIGLINAVDRFDPERGVEPGRVRRAHHPRRDQAALPRPRLGRAGAQTAAGACSRGWRPSARSLTQQHGRGPTVAEPGHRRRRQRGDRPGGPRGPAGVRRGAARRARRPHGAGRRLRRRGRRARGRRRPGVAAAAAARSAPREKRILVLRFARGLSQSQIAQELGISQMHVSRLLARTVEQPAPRARRGHLTSGPRRTRASVRHVLRRTGRQHDDERGRHREGDHQHGRQPLGSGPGVAADDDQHEPAR